MHVCADDVKTRLPERMPTVLMWMLMEVVSGVRIVECHAITDVVIDFRVMEYHASMDVVSGARVVLCHQVTDHSGFSTFQNFPLRVQILNLLSCCSNSSSLCSLAILCTHFAPRKHVI